MSAETLDAAIGGAERGLLDTSALIAFHTPQESAHPLAKHLLGRVERDGDPLSGFYSVISAAELLVRPMRSGPEKFVFMHAFLQTFPHLSVLPMDLSVAIQAATLRAATGLRLPDAIVIASGMLAGCEAMISNDERWVRRLAPVFRQFRWILLSDHL